jgi:predicted TIM-barrel fold metal-dependent hydrolase
MVESLGVPAAITSTPQNFETMGHNLLNVLDKHPDLIVQIVHGIDPPSCLMSDGSVAIPESMISAVKNYNVYLELLPGLDGMADSPNRYGRNDEVIKAFYDTFGPSRLMWGSEFTNVWLPTVNQYRYQFEYLKNHCEYMTDEDLALIMGGNAMRIYGLQ